MTTTYLQETTTYIIFLGAIFILLSDILIKLDPRLNNLLNQTLVEKELLNIKLTLSTVIYLFILEIFIIELNSYFIIFENYNS